MKGKQKERMNFQAMNAKTKAGKVPFSGKSKPSPLSSGEWKTNLNKDKLNFDHLIDNPVFKKTEDDQ